MQIAMGFRKTIVEGNKQCLVNRYPLIALSRAALKFRRHLRSELREIPALLAIGRGYLLES
jgi:hypothetical protein